MMSKPYDYADLWDSFSEEERICLLSNLPQWRTLYGNELHKQWRFLPSVLRIELGAVNWEFSLGRRFAPPS